MDPRSVEGGAASRFRHGMRYPLRALRYLWRRPELWPYVLAPALINMVLLVGSTIASFALVPWAVKALLGAPEEARWFALWVVLVFLLALIVFGLCLTVLYALSGLIALPFQELLSSRLEDRLLGELVEEIRLSRVLGDLFMSLRHSLAALLLWLSLMGPLLLLNLFPPLGELLYLGAGGLITSAFLARELADSPLSRRRLSFGTKLAWVRQEAPLWLGLGAATGLMLWIPLMNFFCLPVAVAGGTLLFSDLVVAGRYPQDPRRGSGGEAFAGADAPGPAA